MITCEEVFELQVGLPDTVAMQTRQPNLEGEGEIRQRRLIKEALRMRPDRLLVGEVRQEECLDLLIAFNSGMPVVEYGVTVERPGAASTARARTKGVHLGQARRYLAP